MAYNKMDLFFIANPVVLFPLRPASLFTYINATPRLTLQMPEIAEKLKHSCLFLRCLSDFFINTYSRFFERKLNSNFGL